jgi:hypothetical protein
MVIRILMAFPAPQAALQKIGGQLWSSTCIPTGSGEEQIEGRTNTTYGWGNAINIKMIAALWLGAAFRGRTQTTMPWTYYKGLPWICQIVVLDNFWHTAYYGSTFVRT